MSEGADRPFRLLPRVTASNEHFWRSGRDGVLRMLRCDDCATWIHPPSPRCPECWSKHVAPADLSGRGVVHTFTLNHQPWVPAPDHPYVVAIVELVEQAGLRLMTNIVGCEPDTVEIGMPVRVVFHAYDDDVWFPLFEPVP